MNGMLKVNWQAAKKAKAIDDPVVIDSEITGLAGPVSLDAPRIGGLDLIATGDGNALDTFKTRIWMKRKFGPWRLVADVTWELGAALVAADPQTGEGSAGYRYAHKATITEDAWPRPLSQNFDNGQNRVATLQFSTHGNSQLYIEVYAMDCDNAKVYFSYID